MAEYFSINFVNVFLTLLLCVFAENNPIEDFKESNAPVYIKMSMDKDKICDPLSPITIGSKSLVKSIEIKPKNPAILVYPGHSLDNWRGSSDKDCKFKVKTAKNNEGLFAVIQSMKLRKNGSECLDYIRFTPENGVSSQKFCGNYERISGIDNNYENNGIQILNNQDSNEKILVKNYEELSLSGRIITEIHIAKEPLNPRELLNLTITYTPYRDCSKDEIESNSQIFPRKNMCISTNYVCDGFTNCVNSMCSDEDNMFCSRDEMNTIEGYKTLTLTAVTSTFLCFIIFVMCLYICRKNEKLCWSSDCAGPPNSVNASGLPMDRGDQSAGNRPYIPTAPMLEVAVPSVHDKDLPPSYDSLFPAETSTAST